MKYLLPGIGLFLTIASIIQFFSMIADYRELGEYGTGIVWGNGILFSLGIIALYFGIKRWNRNME